MDRRRALSARPATSEELQCWAHASSALNTFRDKYNNSGSREAMERVNRSMLAWSGEDEPLEGFETVKATYKKLNSGLSDIKGAAEAEVKAIDQALEALSVLIALRKAPESPVNQDKRNKRNNRGSSPLSNPSTPAPQPTRITLNLKTSDRGSEGPAAPAPQPAKHDAKSRLKYHAKQLPLHEGRKVAFHPPSTGGTEADENTWILAVVLRCLSAEKNKYEVQDPEPLEDGQPGQKYITNIKSMIPLPDPDASPNSPSHLNAYPTFQPGSTVMALYPDTSCFYRAQVVEILGGGREPNGRGSAQKSQYRLRFEDDDDQVHIVPPQWVVEWPGS